jgi:NDP-sugar pyrophosphorylase family protein
MKAMILAAGLGTRLLPLTSDRPKALVTIGGRTLLEIVLCRLQSFGIREVIVNTHHYADTIVDYLRANDNFGIRIEISREEFLLDTGGGLKNAAEFFLEPGPSFGQPFILHNVDVISNIDLEAMVRFHLEHDALATLAVQDRPSTRLLLFDGNDRLCGRRIPRPADEERAPERLDQFARPCADSQALAFSGIHVISSEIFAKMGGSGAFSIIDAYLGLAAQGENILAFRAGNSYWRDLGRPQSLVDAERDMASGLYREL